MKELFTFLPTMSWPCVVSNIHWCRVFPLLLVGSAFCAVPALGQQLETLSVTSTLNITRTTTAAPVVFLGPRILATNTDRTHYDEIGYRLGVAGRWRMGNAGWFGQAEAGYTSTSSQRYSLLTPNSAPFLPDDWGVGHQIRRWEIAPLVGKHTSRRTYVLAGPVLAYNLRAEPGEVRPDTRINDEIYNSLMRSVNRVQLLAQVGVGVTFGRFDFNLRYEHSLTPYTRRFTFQGLTYGYNQRIRQGLFTTGFALYKRRVEPKATTP